MASTSAWAVDSPQDRKARSDELFAVREGTMPGDPATARSPLLVGTELASDGGFEVGSSPSGSYSFTTVSSSWTWQYSGTMGSYNPRYWSSTTSPAHSGNWCVFFDLGPSTDRLYQNVTIPSGASATLSFWLKVGTSETLPMAWDTLRVSVTDISGSVPPASLAYSNLDAAVGYIWVNHTLDVSAFAGKTVRLQFDAYQDSTNNTSFLLDDVSILASSPNSGNCTENANTMCLVNGRYRVTSYWQNQYAGGVQANLQKTKLTDTTGAFWITNSSTYEYLIRINTATDNGRAWVAIPTFTDVEFFLVVTDTINGQTKQYHSSPGNRTLIYDPSYFVYP